MNRIPVVMTSDETIVLMDQLSLTRQLYLDVNKQHLLSKHHDDGVIMFACTEL